MSSFLKHLAPAEFQAMGALVVFSVFPFLTKFFLPSLWVLFVSSRLFDLIYIVAACFALRKLAGGARFTGPFPDLSGKVVVLTGAAAPGIGFHTCVELARLGATVLIGVRGAERAKREAAEIAKSAGVPENKVVGLSLDLGNLKDVKRFAEAVLEHSDQIDILINNAGVMACPYGLTVDGLETQMGTNHFGHFYLTQLLLPALLKAKGRVVIVSSSAHYLLTKGIDYEKMAQKETYSSQDAYGQSKLANVYHAAELQRRFGDQGLRAYSLHPGGVSTALQRHLQLLSLLIKPIELLTFKAPLQGAQTSLFCALSDKAVPGAHHLECAYWDSHMLDAAKAQKWWEFSEEVIRQKTASF